MFVCRGSSRTGTRASAPIFRTLVQTRVACVLVASTVVTASEPAFAQERDRVAAPKQATAVRAGAGSIRLDGRLDEPIWTTAPTVTDFVQKEPVEGAPPTDPMQIRFLYDDDALYVGARMLAQSSAAIQAPLSRRDDVDQAEYLLVSLDTFLDRRTAYTFGVTASGVRLDHFHPEDDEESQDREFDPVWQARAVITDAGWTTEMWIPFSQLRFNDQPDQLWGLNIQRWIPSRNEEVYWILIPRTVQGWASRFGRLDGIQGLPPTRRIELLPYVGGGATLIGDSNPADPFDDGAN